LGVPEDSQDKCRKKKPEENGLNKRRCVCGRPKESNRQVGHRGGRRNTLGTEKKTNRHGGRSKGGVLKGTAKKRGARGKRVGRDKSKKTSLGLRNFKWGRIKLRRGDSRRWERNC